jgi:hypothetical protein
MRGLLRIEILAREEVAWTMVEGEALKYRMLVEVETSHLEMEELEMMLWAV